MNNDRTIQNRLSYLQKIYAGAFSLLLIVGIAVCAICDLAISHSFTWSLYPISSIIFGWLVFIPAIRFGGKGICGSLVACTIFIAPYLLVLNKIIKTNSSFLPVSLSMAAVGVASLWIVYVLFQILRRRKLLAAAITVLLFIPINIFVSFILSKITSEVFFDGWDIMDISIMAMLAIVLFILDLFVQKKKCNIGIESKEKNNGPN